MHVELLVIPDCPGTREAAVLLRAALDDVGLRDLGFTVEVIESISEASSRGFVGSPAFFVDGTDLFAPPVGGAAMACRVYPTPEGPRNVPSLRDLRQVLEQRAATTG